MDPKRRRSKSRRTAGAKWGATVLLGIFVAAIAFTNPIVFGVFGALSEVHAEEMWQATIGPPVKPTPCGNIMTITPITGLCTDVGVAQRMQDRVENAIEFQLLTAAMYGFLDAATYMAQTLAYDTASWIANGGPASGPLFYGKNFGNYLADTAKDAMGEFVATLSTDFTSQFGLNLCKPPNWQALNLQLALSIPDIAIPLKRPTPRCPWSVLTNNWSTAASSLSNADALANIGATFQMGGNDLSYALSLHTPLLDAIAGKEQGAILDRLEGAGYKSVTDYVTGNIKTPSQTVRENFNQQLIYQPAANENYNRMAIIGNAFQLGFVEIGKATLSTFVNTLASKLLSKVMKGLFQPSTGGSSGSIDFTNPFAAPAQTTQPQQIFSEQFKNILTPKLTPVEEENLLAELQASCSGAGRSRWSCAIDANLALALTQGGMTVREALDKGFINPNAKLIPSSDIEQNQDPTCASNGDRFCVANLRKLRLARVIPIGWELAAESPSNYQRCTGGQGCITFGEVVSKFDDCNDDASHGGNAAGTLDAEHPWCHLIDPNWVLAAFPSKCMVKGYGNTLLQGTSDRMFECQDTVTCLRRDADGKCTGGYGYCLAEQPFWQFDADSCKEQYVSCRMFTPRGTNAKPIGYLRSTVDYGSCSASNVGCMWYATTRNPSAGADAWTATYAGSLGKAYFNAKTAACDAKNDGCTELKTVVPGQRGVNLIENGSFELADPDAQGELLGWRRFNLSQRADGKSIMALGDQAPTVADGDPSADGARAFVPPPSAGGPQPGQLVRLDPTRQYTLSLYARRGSAAPSIAGAYIEFYGLQNNDPNLQPLRWAGSISGQGMFKSAGCAGEFNIYGGGADRAGVAIPSTIGTDWQRFQCSFVPPKDAAWGIVLLSAGNASALIDAVQLEESEVATPFGEGVNPSLETIHMKIPPPELGCSGADNDNPLCASYAKVCRENEAGCNGYRLTRQPGSPEIPAVLSPVDACPAECVGYAEFRKQPSTFDYTHNPNEPLLDDPNDETVAYFIPDTARFCTASDVGCEQFTNLGAAGQGGDQSGAYSYLRMCHQPGDASQTYYTWEGSEETGYQLRTWSMIRDMTAPAPQGPAILERPGPDGKLKSPADCNADTYLRGFDPDCRQFYDPQGNVFYRFESQTILSDADCQQFRLDRSSEADCRLTGGSFNAQTNSCTYEAIGSKSKSCAPAVAGCRGYVGTAGKSQALVWSQDFTDAGFASQVTAGSGAAIALSTESVLVGDQSLKIVPGASGSISFAPPTESGVLYELSFWAKRAGTPAAITVTAESAGAATTIGSPSLSSDWRVFRIGPFSGDAAAGASTTRITIGNLGNTATFIDKIRVERVSDVSYVIKDSWATPAICDQTPEGIAEPHAMLGCEAYTARTGGTVNARQFSRLCRENAIGCTAYVNTENTDSPYETRWEKPGSGNSTEVTVAPADHYDYFIPAKSKMCPESAKGCRAFGLPQFTQDRLALQAASSTSGGPFKTVYLKDDPSAYDTALCSEPELFCEAYTYNAAGQSGTAYFRAPSDHACEYKEGVVVGKTCGLSAADQARFTGRTYDGWFKVGTDCPCYTDRLVTGSAFGLRYTGDAGYNAWAGASPSLYPANQTYRGWTATCPEPQAECTELRDPNDKSDPLHPMGRVYDVINDDRLDTESCNGQVDPGNGCVLFRDTSDNRLLYSSAATEQAYKDRAYRPVGPIDCVTTPDHPSCVKVTNLTIGAYCYNSNDQPVCQNAAQSGRAGYLACLQGETMVGRFFHPCNDTNLIVKVKPDRACSQWLACRTGETVYDQSDGSFKNICSDLALCNASGETGAEGVPFCTSYVDRKDAMATIFQPFTVTDAATYASRPVGFGSVDYGGDTVPSHFQVMDTVLKPIGSFITTDPRIASKLKKDYRLGVPVPAGSLWTTPDAASAAAIASGASDLVPYICVFKQTGAFGLRTTADGTLSKDGTVCWLSVDQERPPALGPAASTIVSDNLAVPFLEKRFAQDENPKLDQMLSRAFPDTQCKASPEANAPFGNAYVIEWDDSVNPPSPKRVTDGYANATFCEYGEDCECVYKKVSYKGPNKFYAPLSTDVVNAICQGGPRDGLPCIADVSIAGSVDPAGGGATGTAGVNYQSPHIQQNQQCGSGTCVPLSDSTLVRGVTGQCLEYDISRPRAGGTSESECLLWNPNPILTGPGDQYHWQPTAGFQPPQSSGRYYCSSPVRKPRSQQFWPFSWRPKDTPREGFSWESVVLSLNPYTGPAYTAYRDTVDTAALLTGSNTIGVSVGCGDKMNCISGVGFTPNSAGTFAGAIKALFYADWYASDGSCVNFLFVGGCTGNEGGASLDGMSSDGTQIGYRCEQIDDEDQAYIYKTDTMRLVTTGQGINRSYAEYAFLMNPVDVSYAALGYKPTDKETVLDYSIEDAIANFEFSVPAGKIGCGYSEEWADVHVKDYDGDRNSWKGTDDTWHANFTKYLQDGGGKLDRKTAQIVTEDGSSTGIPVKADCMIKDADRAPDDGTCYMKTWEIDYRAEGQDKFMAFTPDIGRESLDKLSTHPVYGKCDSDHPWFAIRAVFEDVNAQENGLDPLEISPEQLTGPFQFVGLWVSSCMPGGETRYIYMTMKMNSADVCRELLETVSKDSHDSTAFTDRNSADSGFSLRNGYTWNTTNVPFGASLATGDAGKQPLYMSGVRQSDVNPLNPPTFTYPGQTYFQATKYPTSNWGLLSNVFARIYRIYGYNSRGVGRDDWACTDLSSPEFGQWCPNLENVSGPNADAAKTALAEEYCGYGGKCVKGSLDATNVFAQKACNSFSGVNRGLDCSGDPDICHIAPMQEENGVPTPLYGQCVLFQGYAPADASHGVAIDARWSSVNKNYRCVGANCPSSCTTDIGCSRADAIKGGAFRCQGSVRDPSEVKETITVNGTTYATYASYCTKLSQESHECAYLIPEGSGTCNKVNQSDEFGTCGGSPWAQCAQDEDCSFEARNWWPSGDSNSRFMTTMSTQFGDWALRLGYYDKALDAPHHDPIPAGFYYAQGSTPANSTAPLGTGLQAYDNRSAALAAFAPAIPYDVQQVQGTYAGQTSSQSMTTPTWISPSLANSVISVTYDDWNDQSLMALQPGFNPLIFFTWGNPQYFNASWNVSTDPTAPVTVSYPDSPPYVSYKKGSGGTESMYAHYGACESVALMYLNNGSTSTIAGTCRGGVRAGAACGNDNDCKPDGKKNSDADQWCNPVTSGAQSDPSIPAYAPTAASADCWPNYDANSSRNPRLETDTTLDTNICTHPPGYWPRPNYCSDPNDEYCGLFGYDLAFNMLDQSVNDAAPLPTDVTAGLYTPRFLNPTRYGADTTMNFNYVNYYSPVPPHTAAPDVRACQGQQCRVAGLDTLSLDGAVGGTANGGVGSHVATLRFYAWASHEQMPLRRVIVDWGDGTVTELPDAYMKNRKPYCETSKECTDTPGLTCQTDNDCPPGGGSCQTYGNCTNNPNLRCYNDTQCALGGQQGVCEKRIPFGNTQDACDDRYLEFRHAYACAPQAADTCGDTSRCSRDSKQLCSAGCAAGDTCVDSMAPPAGCYELANNRCLFTPRVMLIDNWGWCTGECRAGTNPRGALVDVANALVLHPNGGCYDASKTMNNINFSSEIGPNECGMLTYMADRPWIVFPGALQLLPGEAL